MPDARAPFPVAYVGDVPFQVASLEDACAWILHTATEHSAGVNVRLANAYNVALAHEDHNYRDLLSKEGINFPDGTPVAWYMKRQSPGAERVRGPSLFPRTLALSEHSEIKHYFLGGTPETLAQLETVVRQNYSGLNIVGTYSPPFATVDDTFVNDCVRRVEASGADVIWIGLGTPKQDQLGTSLARETNTISVNVGAAFDFLAGTVREAPHWIQKSGFEWLYRLAQEPRRLWKRYLLGNLRFLYAASISTHRPRERRAMP